MRALVALVLLLLGTSRATSAQLVFPVPAGTDTSGWTRIFNGRSLEGWEGDPTYWRVEDGSLVGEVTPQTLLRQNSFIIWRGGTVADFELKVEYRVSARGNSGINYRSVELPGDRWVLRGYQADIDGELQWTGQNYEERGREFLALRGQVTRTRSVGPPQIVASVGDSVDLKRWVKGGDWNEYHLVVRGNVMTHVLNGHVMSQVIDDDVAKRRMDGLLGVQVHVGPPMKIEYRTILLRRL